MTHCYSLVLFTVIGVLLKTFTMMYGFVNTDEG